MNLDEHFSRLESQGIPKYFIQCVNKLAYGVAFVGSFNWEKTIIGYIKTYWDYFGKDLDSQEKGELVCKKVFYHFTVSKNQRKSLLPSVSDLMERRYVIQKDMNQAEYWEELRRPIIRTEEQSKKIKLFFKNYSEQRFNDGFCHKEFLKNNNYLLKKWVSFEDKQ